MVDLVIDSTYHLFVFIVFSVVVCIILKYLFGGRFGFAKFDSNSEYKNGTNGYLNADKNEHESRPNESAAVDRNWKNENIKKSSKLSKINRSSNKSSKSSFVHKWLSNTLKGHTGIILDMDLSSNGKYLVTVADDSCCYIWFTKCWGNKDHVGSNNHRLLLEVDYASRCAFSPDSKAVLLNLYHSRTIRVYKLSKDGKAVSLSLALEFVHQQATEVSDILTMEIAGNGKFIMTSYTDTTIRLWNLKGELLSTLDTCQMNNNMIRVSPCGRFVASCGFTPDVKVWEVVFSRSGDFVAPVNRVFDLKGHNAQVCDVSFSADSTKMVSISIDGTWRLWSIDIRFKDGQDPELLVKGSFTFTEGIFPRIALSRDNRVVAVTNGGNVSMFSCYSETSQLLETFSSVHHGTITHLKFDNSDQFLISIGDDRYIPILHNVPGLRCVIDACKMQCKLSKNSNSKKEMYKQEMELAEKVLATLPA